MTTLLISKDIAQLIAPLTTPDKPTSEVLSLDQLSISQRRKLRSDIASMLHLDHVTCRQARHMHKH